MGYKSKRILGNLLKTLLQWYKNKKFRKISEVIKVGRNDKTRNKIKNKNACQDFYTDT